MVKKTNLKTWSLIAVLLLAIANVTVSGDVIYVDDDPAVSKMYWTDTGKKEINRAALDGSFRENLLRGLGIPRGPDYLGGGLLCEGGGPMINNCTFTKNSADHDGGAITRK